MKPNVMNLFMIFILALSNFTEIYAYTENTYNKSENDQYFSKNTKVVLPNGSILFRFYKDCNEPDLHLRILDKNGILTTFDVEKFSIPRLNFCKPVPSDHISISIFQNKLYLSYYNFSESDITVTLSLEGKILRDTWIGPDHEPLSGTFLQYGFGNPFYYMLPVGIDTFLWIKYDPPNFKYNHAKCKMQSRLYENSIHMCYSSSSITKLLLISFLSSGSVIDIIELNNEIYHNAQSVGKLNLYSKGYLLYYMKKDLSGCEYGGDIYDDNDNWYSKLELPENFTIQNPCFAFNNEVEEGFEMISKITTNNFTMITASLPKFVDDGRNYKLILANIESFDPPDGSKNTEYMIYIEPHFVKQNDTNEPMIGIDPFIWNLYTENEENSYAESFSGSVRLTSEGTDKFLESIRTEFVFQLIQEISSILPVDIDRLESKGSYQIDTSTLSKQVIIPLQIKSTKDTYKRNADDLQKDLDIMIKYNGISKNNHTSFLDQTYGYKFRGATNIEALNILSSKFAGLSIFSANYSEKIQILLFWCGLLNFIIEDIPQFIIQILYKIQIVSYNIISFLTLITSSLIITINILNRLYNSIIQYQQQRQYSKHIVIPVNNNSDFENLDKDLN
ncbi:20074_t:CDS:2 [Funneliformis geosporum]|nr:20074_t:CDS:2 [Funneliformis geosporum]